MWDEIMKNMEVMEENSMKNIHSVEKRQIIPFEVYNATKSRSQLKKSR
jgi:hypothetical protein